MDWDLDIIKTNLAQINMDMPTHHMWSDTQFEIIKRYIQDFEKKIGC